MLLVCVWFLWINSRLLELVPIIFFIFLGMQEQHNVLIWSMFNSWCTFLDAYNGFFKIRMWISKFPFAPGFFLSQLLFPILALKSYSGYFFLTTLLILSLKYNEQMNKYDLYVMYRFLRHLSAAYFKIDDKDKSVFPWKIYENLIYWRYFFSV